MGAQNQSQYGLAQDDHQSGREFPVLQQQQRELINVLFMADCLGKYLFKKVKNPCPLDVDSRF